MYSTHRHPTSPAPSTLKSCLVRSLAQRRRFLPGPPAAPADGVILILILVFVFVLVTLTLTHPATPGSAQPPTAAPAGRDDRPSGPSEQAALLLDEPAHRHGEVAHEHARPPQLEHVPQQAQREDGVSSAAAAAVVIAAGAGAGAGVGAGAQAQDQRVRPPGLLQLAQQRAVVVQQLQLRRRQLVVRVEGGRRARGWLVRAAVGVVVVVVDVGMGWGPVGGGGRGGRGVLVGCLVTVPPTKTGKGVKSEEDTKKGREKDSPLGSCETSSVHTPLEAAARAVRTGSSR